VEVRISIYAEEEEIGTGKLLQASETEREDNNNLSIMKSSFAIILLLNLLLVAVSVWGENTEVPVGVQEAVAAEEIPPVEEAAAAAASDNTGGMNSKSNNNHSHEETVCAWGTACHHEHEEGGVGQGGSSEEKKEAVGDQNDSQDYESSKPPTNHESGELPQQQTRSVDNTSTSNSSPPHIPFVHHHHHKHKDHYVPPEGFTITARVYTDPTDKLAHFANDEEGSHITLPYWECGATGSTTTPLPVKDAYFRHALGSSKPVKWSGNEYGAHPQLVVALKRMEMILNSGETKQLKPGDVVLLEDVVSGGHKLKSLDNDFDMTYLLLTLPQHYHHVGRERMSLKKTVTTKSTNPCKDSMWFKGEQKQQQQQPSSSAFVTKENRLGSSWWESASDFNSVENNKMMAAAPLREGQLRKLLFGAIGVSLSTLMADFLGKVAPLWLAVGIGGTCFVVGGTVGFVKGGDYLWTEVEMMVEKRRLAVPLTEEEETERDDIYGVDEAEEQVAEASRSSVNSSTSAAS
jgi:hypothetical protein